MKVGDEITAVDLNGVVVTGVVIEVGPTGRIASTEFIFRNAAEDDTLARFDHEGITWIRGAHPLGSAEFEALFAAWKLSGARLIG